jgi:hypothetical protein
MYSTSVQTGHEDNGSCLALLMLLLPLLLLLLLPWFLPLLLKHAAAVTLCSTTQWLQSKSIVQHT